MPADGFDELTKLISLVPAPSAAVPSTAFASLVSRNETDPVGDTALPDPVTVVVRE